MIGQSTMTILKGWKGHALGEDEKSVEMIW